MSGGMEIRKADSKGRVVAGESGVAYSVTRDVAGSVRLTPVSPAEVEMQDDDWWLVLSTESDKALARWAKAQGDGGLSMNEESAFEYGFELGFRVAKGEVFE